MALFASACENGNSDALQGYIEGDYLYVSSPVGGTVLDTPAAKGTRVEAGAPLFTLEPEPEGAAYREARSQLEAASALYEDKTKGLRTSEMAAIEASIARAEAALLFSKKEYERVRALYEKSIVAEDKLDAARASYEGNEATVAGLREKLKTAGMGARLDQVRAAHKDVERASAAVQRAQWALGKKKGYAPVAALVVDVIYAPGEYAPPGYPIAMLLPPGKVRARFFVPEPGLASLKPGGRVSVSMDGRAEPLGATVSYISPEAEFTPPNIYSKDNRGKLVFMVEAAFDIADAAGLNPGQPVEVRLAP